MSRTFEGIGCCLEAIEKECWRQLQEEKVICASCYLAYKHIYRKCMKDKDRYFSKWLKERKKLYFVFDEYWRGLDK